MPVHVVGWGMRLSQCSHSGVRGQLPPSPMLSFLSETELSHLLLRAPGSGMSASKDSAATTSHLAGVLGL